MNKIISAIIQIIDKEGITVTSLESSIGASKGVISRAIKNHTDIQSKWVEKLVENYPMYNAEWILTGKGEMIKSYAAKNPEVSIVHEKQPTYGYSDQAIPVFDLTASASIQQIFSNQTKIVPMDHIRIPNIPKCDGAISITGDSMYPLLKSGDMILYKEVQSKDNIIWGEMYVMYINNDGDEFFFVKYLQKSDKEGYVKLVSENVHHQAVDFPLDSIKHLAKVQASIRINSQV